ncbi:lysosomal-trafficking regulator isoform X2 [Ornithorhynchus anatinus]|uniref:Lysosomal-trafficking regulator n=1 Tax=Ornithorhynchus anatinus TaxID=9258 RepID=F6Z6P0_ORNAN|nr:lysosomal-trafficking regulator isoform X2 [Ornithorhynchus anatinus]
MSSDSNSLAREFLTDVNRLCNAVVQRAEAREEEEEETHMAALGQYLVQGRGFLLLTQLNSIIDQALTCREELLTLLLSLLPLVWRIPVQEEKAVDFNLPFSADLVLTKGANSSLLKSTQEKPPLDGRTPPAPGPARASGPRPNRHQRRTAQRYSVRDARKSQLSTSDSEANSDEKSLATVRYRRARLTHRLVAPTPEGDPPPARAAPLPAAADHESPGPPAPDEPAAASADSSPFDLCHVLLSLLEKVCKFDGQAHPRSALAASVVPTLTEFLAGSGEAGGPRGPAESRGVCAGWTEEPVALVQRMLSRAVLRLVSVEVGPAEAAPDSLRKNLTEVLRAASGIRARWEKRPGAEGDPREAEEAPAFPLHRHRALLLPELLRGVLQLLIGCLQGAASDPSSFSQAMDLVQEFIQHQGFQLVEAAVLRLEGLAAGEAADHLRALLNWVLRLIGTVKKAKSEQLHQSMCPRKRHRRCEYSHFLHHHRDLSGLLVSAFKSRGSEHPFEESADGEVRYPERCCCIAVCAHQCLRLLRRARLGATRVQILSGIHGVGICCCMDPGSVIGPLLHAFGSPGLKPFQPHVLGVLAQLVLDQLGGAEPSPQPRPAACNVCAVDGDRLAPLEEALRGSPAEGGPAPASASFRSRGILPSSGGEELLWKWDALEAYRSLVLGAEPGPGAQLAGHVCHLVQRGNAVVRWKLYSYVFHPVLQRGAQLALRSRQPGGPQAAGPGGWCLPQEVLQIYLQALPGLLRSRVLRDLFLSCDGVNQMIELNYLDGIRSHSLKALETLIICLGEQQKDSPIPQPDDPGQEQEEFPFLAPPPLPGRPASSESPQSLSRFYAGLRETCPRKRKSADQDAHVNTVNLFLCVAFLCVSREADGEWDLANDSEDTSGYDSTASEPLPQALPALSPESLALPPPEHTRRAADTWTVGRAIYMADPVFQKQFHRLGGLEVCRRLITMIIQKLSRSGGEVDGSKAPGGNARREGAEAGERDREPGASGAGGPEPNGRWDSPPTATAPLGEAGAEDRQERECSLQRIRLLEALLAICLHSARTGQQKMEVEWPNQNPSVDDLLLEMRDHLSRAKVVETDLAKPLFDSLLRVALGDYLTDVDRSEEKTDKNHQAKTEPVSQPGDLSEEAEESQDCNLKLLVEEEGYEADSESNPESSESQEEGGGSKGEAERRRLSCSPGDLTETLPKGELIYPEICTLGLNLLSAAKTRVDVLAHVFESFLRVVRQKEKNVTLLMQQGTVGNLLGGFLSILTQTDSSFQACQIVLMDLLVSLMSSRTCSEELTLLLRIFLEKSPSTEVLLKGILKIVESNTTLSPLQYLTFPLLQIPNLSSSSSSQKCTSIISSKALGLWKRARVSQSRKEADGGAGGAHQLLSSWHVAPIHLPLVGQNCWPHMAEGFSVSLWLSAEGLYEAESPPERGKKMRRRSKPGGQDGSSSGPGGGRRGGVASVSSGETLVDDGCIHLLSLGSKVLMIQVWADLSTGTLIFRMCMDPNDDMKAGLLAQVESQENVFLPGKWQHLTLTYSQQPEGKKNIHGKVSMWVSGQRKPDVALDYTLPRKTSLSSDSNKTFCMVGHCLSSQEELLRVAGRWDLGNLLLFNGAKIGPQEAFYLYACGPDFTSVMPCKYGKSPSDYSKYISKEILQCEQIRDLFMSKKDVDLSLLIEGLAVVYSSHRPAQYTIYEPVIRLKGQVKTTLSQRPFSTKEVQSILLEPHHLKSLQPVEYRTLQGVLHEIGGAGAFVFLFARVVDISSCEETQALALEIVLSLTKYNQERIQEMENCNGFSMIHQVLIKQKCIVGFHFLKTLLEGCCGEEMLHVTEDGQFKLDANSSAVIRDVKLLEELLLDWKIWSKAAQGVWETLLAALEVLIRDNHHQQMFNIKQLLKARVVHHFLLTCQVLQEHKEGHLTSMPREVCRSFVKIIEEVLGSPPDLELLTLIFHFLIAVHPPTNTYVCHNPTNFHFSLHIDGKLFLEKVQSIVYMRHSSSGGKSIASPGFIITSPSGFTASPPEGDASSHLSPEAPSPAALLRSRSLPASPTASPDARPRRLAGSLGRGIDDLQRLAKSDVSGPAAGRGSPALPPGQEDALVSSCESAQTTCEAEEPALARPDGAESGPPAIRLEGREARSDDESAAAGSPPHRPDHLKGLSSFQRSHGNVASLGLAFPAQNAGASAIARWPSLAERGTVPEDWETFAFSPGYGRTCDKTASAVDRSSEDCLVLICCGLYELLRGVLLILPDLMLEDVLDRLIQADTLIVLVNHPSPLIQQGVIKLLDAYFNRASKEQKDKFLKNRGFSLLANQLYLHQGTQELLECFLEMLFGRPIGLEEEIDLEDVKNVGLFRKWSVVPILGLIENSLYDSILLHNSLFLLLQILNSCSKVADLLLDNGLLYVLCNTIATLNGLETNISLNDHKLLVCDIQQLLVAITIHACSSSGPQYFRVIEDLIILLGYLQSSKNKKTQNMAVALQFRVLQAAVNFIKTTSTQDTQNLTNSFQFPSTPHHAIFQKRKSIAGPRRFALVQSESLLMKMRSVASDELNLMMQRKMSQENPIRATETELAQRLQRLVILAINRLIYQEFSPDYIDILSTPETATQSGPSAARVGKSDEEIHHEQPDVTNPFQREMFRTLVEGARVSIVSGRTGSLKQQWTKILWTCKDTFRVQLGRFLVHLSSPARSLRERTEVLEMAREPNLQEILRECLSPTLQHGPKLALYLYELMHAHRDEVTEEELATAEMLLSAVKGCGHKCIPPGAPPKDFTKVVKEEQKKLEAEEEVSKAAWQKTVSNNQHSLFQRLEGKSKDISKVAADITQAVSLSQGIERKKVIQHIRGMYKVDLSASRHWQEMIQQLTHDRALWYDPVCYPTSWQLDPTEGPNRERRRLQRCYLTIPNKYLLRDRQRAEDVVKPPLSYLFEDKIHSSFSSTVKDKAASESIRVNRRCISVAPSRETAGELLLGKCGMYFVEDNASDTIDSSSLQGETDPASFSWTFEEIKEVHRRWWQLRDNAVEIFLTNGRTLLLAFDNTKVRDDVYHNILTNNLPNLLEYGNITALTNLWYSGQITNFEYLTHLNKHAGRSFNDLMQYPVFPFILADYVSETLDLNDPSAYRNLSKPIAVQSKEKEDRYVDTYKYLEEEFRKGAREDDPMPPVQPYHYGSHYSNSGTVLHFLVRMPPFTKMFLAYQDQSFDIPDRTFHSTNTTWRLSSYESMTDVKELIPEFFYLPEFLVNREGFDFGVRQNGERVNHVNLPPWARNDPRLFILIHRQALESDQVSQTICQWIDLVFGYKQKGKASVQAINVFHPATYFGMDVSAVEDPVQRRALETMIKTYGQTPRQLFHTAHANRPGAKLNIEGELPAAMGLLVQFAFRETREQPRDVVHPSPLSWIKGLKWGDYVGSPSAPVPVVCFSQPHGERFGSLQALPTRAICGLSRKFCLLMIYSKEQGVRSMNNTDIQWSAILSWGYADNILRLKSKQSEPPVNFIQSSQLHQVTSCAWVPDSCQLFTGSECGVITAYANRFTSSTPSEIDMESQIHLYGHTEEITGLFVCKPYSIMISVSKDGTCIIWDLNRLCYVQSLAGHKSPVTAVSASETTGDIATVCDSVGGGSDLRLWTVNGDLVGHVHCREIICSVAFSNQPEGVSINVIAGGLENGIVRLWSTWDLKPVREITFPKSNKPIVSLTFSCDGQHLYTANSDGTVIAWCRKDRQYLKQPMFYSFLSSYAAG